MGQDHGQGRHRLLAGQSYPEIWPWEPRSGRPDRGTGRSDFPNQINNSLGFPGIFRGALDVRAKTITDAMCIEAAKELAKVAEDKGIHEEYIVPSMDEWEVFPREAVAVGTKAIEQVSPASISRPPNGSRSPRRRSKKPAATSNS